MSTTHGNWLSDDQVFALNEKFGWMIKADAQSDQSRAFVQAAIDKHECIRKAAPELLEALQAAANYIDILGGVSKEYRKLIVKALGEPS